MINFEPIIQRIDTLLAEDSDASVTYAALEARLALEKVCYDRLKHAHAYISHAELRRWQPSAVVKQLIQDVDKHVADTLTLWISKRPAVPGVYPPDDDYVEVGTQIGFDAKRVEELWNALSNLGLHVKLPKNNDDPIPDYGDRAKIRAKVEDVRTELERLSKGTMGFSGIGAEVSFECGVCETRNKRRVALLREGQRIYCIEPTCDASFIVHKDGDAFGFQGETCDFACKGCGHMKHLPWRFFRDKLKFGDRAIFRCHGCNHTNYVEWRLTQVAPATVRDDDTVK
jgi:hypothetical protein